MSATSERIMELDEIKRRNLSLSLQQIRTKDFAEELTELECEMLDDLKVTYLHPHQTLDNVEFNKLYEPNGARYIHDFTPEEDAFIARNYKQVSDMKLALALQLRTTMVRTRRYQLGLVKERILQEVVIWEREKNEDRPTPEDC